jgi:menaquinone-dependent protoporphyrinogen oxidase
LYEYAVSTCFAGGEFLFEKMNFFERAIIKRIAKTDKSVSQIKEEEIGRFAVKYQKTNINRPEKGIKRK